MIRGERFDHEHLYGCIVAEYRVCILVCYRYKEGNIVYASNKEWGETDAYV